jgi:hypothetical protein
MHISFSLPHSYAASERTPALECTPLGLARRIKSGGSVALRNINSYRTNTGPRVSR